MERCRYGEIAMTWGPRWRAHRIGSWRVGLLRAAAALLLWLATACGPADEDARGVAASTPLPSFVPAEEGLHFADVTQQAGIDFVYSIGDDSLSNLVESSGGGAAFLDYDQDGYLDLYVVNGAFIEGFSQGPRPKGSLRNRLYRNRGDGTFEDATDRAGTGDSGYGMGVVVADYDNDGYPDIYVSNYGPNVLYHNNGDGTFSELTDRAGVGGAEASTGSVWLDYDNDGLLDLYVGNYIDFDPEYSYYYAPDGFPGPLAYRGQADVLYRNRGDGTFEDVTERVGVYRPEGRAMGVSAVDYDGDGYVDIYVANDAMQNYLFHNEGGQRFRDVALRAGVAYNHQGDATSTMAVDFADYDGDGLLDMYVSDLSFSALYRNEGMGLFVDRTYSAGIAAQAGQFVGWGVAFLDYDNDGDPDIFQVNGEADHLFGQEDQLFEDLGDGTFRDVSLERGRYFRNKLVGRGAAFGDYDNDGDVDVFIVNLNDRGVLLRNEGGSRNGWLLIRLVGRSSNRDGVGTRVTVVTGDRAQVAQKKSATGYLSQNDPRMHFGLGAATVVDRIEVRWPSGKLQLLEAVRARQILTITEP
ncbi:MAG: CRTAC1 family protein [Gemmatimonadota bacterium]